MITFDQALQIIAKHATTMPVEEVKVAQALGGFLARDVKTPQAIPRFDQSAMDGFAVKAADINTASEIEPAKLKIVGEIKAGDTPKGVLKSGEAMRIMTGAGIPKGAEAVAMREYCEEKNGHVFVQKNFRPGTAIRLKGEELPKGSVAIKKGSRITPPVLGLITTFGLTHVKIYKRPAITIISTGNEIRPVGKPLKPGQIYDSNSWQLQAALCQLSIKKIKLVCAKDKPSILKKTFQTAFENSDIVISIGGVSVGDYDFVKDVVKQLNVETLFWGIAMKPGKPNYFGRRKDNSKKKKGYDKLIFGLPGNPVSAMVSYHQLIKPALLKMMGATKVEPEIFRALITEPISKSPGRLEFIRGKLELVDGHWGVTPTKGQGSHMISGLAEADCLIHFDLDQSQLETGANVKVQKIDWTA